MILESILETKAATIPQFVGVLRGSLLVTFEEGTSAAWLYYLLKPHVTFRDGVPASCCHSKKNHALPRRKEVGM